MDSHSNWCKTMHSPSNTCRTKHGPFNSCRTMRSPFNSFRTMHSPFNWCSHSCRTMSSFPLFPPFLRSVPACLGKDEFVIYDKGEEEVSTSTLARDLFSCLIYLCIGRLDKHETWSTSLFLTQIQIKQLHVFKLSKEISLKPSAEFVRFDKLCDLYLKTPIMLCKGLRFII